MAASSTRFQEIGFNITDRLKNIKEQLQSFGSDDVQNIDLQKRFSDVRTNFIKVQAKQKFLQMLYNEDTFTGNTKIADCVPNLAKAKLRLQKANQERVDISKEVKTKVNDMQNIVKLTSKKMTDIQQKLTNLGKENAKATNASSSSSELEKKLKDGHDAIKDCLQAKSMQRVKLIQLKNAMHKLQRDLAAIKKADQEIHNIGTATQKGKRTSSTSSDASEMSQRYGKLSAYLNKMTGIHINHAKTGPSGVEKLELILQDSHTLAIEFPTNGGIIGLQIKPDNFYHDDIDAAATVTHKKQEMSRLRWIVSEYSRRVKYVKQLFEECTHLSSEYQGSMDIKKGTLTMKYTTLNGQTFSLDCKISIVFDESEGVVTAKTLSCDSITVEQQKNKLIEVTKNGSFKSIKDVAEALKRIAMAP